MFFRVAGIDSSSKENDVQMKDFIVSRGVDV